MKYNSLLESLDKKVGAKVEVRRYNLSDMISESYKTLYSCEQGSRVQRLAEAHLDDVRKNPQDIERLSRQLSIVKEVIKLHEAGEITDKDLASATKSKFKGDVEKPVAKENEKRTAPTEEIKESVDAEDDLLEDTELTDEEVEELTKHLSEIRKAKKIAECDAQEQEVQESIKGRKLKRRVSEAEDAKPDKKEDLEEAYDKYSVTASDLNNTISNLEDIITEMEANDIESLKLAPNTYGLYNFICFGGRGFLDLDNPPIHNGEDDEDDYYEAKTYESLNLSEFSKKSENKAFFKTLKKLNSKLHEGNALTRQESIALYKAANSALTQLSVELEHNPAFLDTFNESVSLLSVDVDRVLESLKANKAPSKKTMKSLAKFAEALLYEADEDTQEEEEELPPIEDEEINTEGEIDDFDQEYADARIEMHNELADAHAEDEDPAVAEKLAQDTAEILELPGVTEEQAAELLGEEPASEDAEEEPAEAEEEPEDTDESADPKKEEDDLDLGDDEEITDEELADLKKYLREMRESKKKA